MREFALSLAIVVASLGSAHATPAYVPTQYPDAGMFCGFMELCPPKATAPKDRAAADQAKQVVLPRPAQ